MGLATLSNRVESAARGPADGAEAIAREGKRVVEKGARVAAPWIATSARLGYLAKGLLYGTIGGLALLSALGSTDGKTLDSKGALAELHAQWYGTALVIGMTVGLAGHAAWRLVQGVLDPEGEVRAARVPWIQRAALLVRGTLHLVFVVWCAKLLLGEERAEQDGTRSLTADVLAWHPPLGAIAVGLMGAGVAAFGISELHKAWTERFADKLDGRLPSWGERGATWLARIGTTARGALFALIGVFMVRAAFEGDPDEAKGLGSTLGSLHGWSYGWLVLGAAAAGLLAYAVFQVVKARHRSVAVV